MFEPRERGDCSVANTGALPSPLAGGRREASVSWSLAGLWGKALAIFSLSPPETGTAK